MSELDGRCIVCGSTLKAQGQSIVMRDGSTLFGPPHEYHCESCGIKYARLPDPSAKRLTEGTHGLCVTCKHFAIFKAESTDSSLCRVRACSAHALFWEHAQDDADPTHTDCDAWEPSSQRGRNDQNS
jgi:hypothetical protein